jgi:hypothetical protein
VVNASGTNNGIPYIQSINPIQPGAKWTNFVKFYDQFGIPFHPILQAQLLSFSNVPPQITDASKTDETFQMNVFTKSNRVYLVQYSSNLQNWDTAEVGATGDGSEIQWTDINAGDGVRFYRAIELP